MKKIIVAILSIISLAIVFQLGQHQGTTAQSNMSAKAAESDSGDTDWSPTKPYPKHNGVVKKKWTLFLSRFFHCHHFFKFFRTQIPKIRMTAPTVAPHFYIINDITPSLFPG